MKTLIENPIKVGAIFTTIIAIILLSLSIRGGVIGHYQFERDILSYWNLADKSSTIERKSEYIDKFVESLAKLKYEGKYNAIFLTTIDNSFDANYEALKSFQSRLKEIKSMDIRSFEYQTAIQQITGQEQGEAYDMILVFRGIWWKTNHFLLWDWVCGVQIALTLIILTVGIVLWVQESDTYTW